jgi:signal transduction histidine kinase
MRAVLRWISIVLLFLLGACAPAERRDAIVERSWLDDRDENLSPEAALERSWSPFSGSLSRGYTASTTWLRVKVDPAAATPVAAGADRRLVLRILPGHLDEVAVFRADRPAELSVRVGDAHPVAGPRHGLLVHAVVLDDAPAPFELLLRLRTQSNHSIDVEVLRWDDSREASIAQLGLVIAYLVFTLMVMAWAAAGFLARRDAVLGLFVAQQASMLLVTLTLLGVLRLYGPDGLAPALDRLTSLAIPLSGVVSVRFHARLLADVGCPPRFSRLVLASAAVPGLGLLLVALGQVRAGLFLTHATLPFMMVLTMTAAWKVSPDTAKEVERTPVRQRAVLVASYVASFLVMLPQSLRVLGLATGPRWTYGAYFIHGVTSTVLLGGLLAVRARQARARHRRAQLDAEQSRREAEAQRARVAEQSELLTMLTHELRTPLSVVSLALGESGRSPSMRERAQRAVRNMNDVIERCSQTALFDDELSRHDASPVLEPVALDRSVTSAIAALEHADRVECCAAPELPTCLADPKMLRVIIGNLFENALKYGPPEGRVTAVVEPASREGRAGVMLRVSNAVGAAGRPDPAHLFEKYHRGVGARHGSGSGLGLYLSQRLAYRLGGLLEHRPKSGDDDVVFELWLPA